MSEIIIGRKAEQEILRKCVESKSPELIAIYGRRRIGKTYLVRQYFNDAFSFYSTGIYQGTKREQLSEFNRQLAYYSGRKWELAKDWFDAFAQLREYLASIDGNAPIVVFLDELPWMDTQKSRFIKALEYFWNSWGTTNYRLKVIILKWQFLGYVRLQIQIFISMHRIAPIHTKRLTYIILIQSI